MPKPRGASVISLCTALAAITATLAITSPAHAAGVDPASATPVQREQAQSRFLRGKQLMAQKQYADALIELDASLEIVGSPNTRLLKARCLRAMGRLVAAYVEFGRTIVEAKELARADTRYEKAAEGATGDRAAIAPLIGFVTVNVTHASDTSKLLIAGEEIRRAAWNEPAPVMPGETTLRVETPGRPPATQAVKLAAGEKKAVTIDAGEPPPVAAAPKPDASTHETASAEAPGDRTKLRPYAYVAGGVGVAGLIAFTFFGLKSNATFNDLQSQCHGPCPPSKADDISTGKTQQRIANVGLVVGVLGAAAGVTLFVLSQPKKDEAPAATAALGPGWIGVRGAF